MWVGFLWITLLIRQLRAVMPRLASALVGLGLLAPVGAYYVPTWNATWQMNRSTLIMPCNYSGDLDPANVANFGIVDIDWSQGQATYAKQRRT